MKIDLQPLCRSIKSLCDDASNAAISPQDFNHRLWKAAESVRALVYPPHEPGEREQRDTQRSLLSWARDMRVQDFVQQHKVHIDRKTQWRWIDATDAEGQTLIGKVDGLGPNSKFRGVPRITNGILVAIECADGDIRMGHYDWFVLDAKTREHKQTTTKKPTQKSIKEQEFITGLRKALLS